MLSSVLNAAAVLMNTQRPARDQASQISSMDRERGLGEPPLSDNYCRSLFLSKGDHWNVVYAPWISPYPVTYNRADWTQWVIKRKEYEV